MLRYRLPPQQYVIFSVAQVSSSKTSQCARLFCLAAMLVSVPPLPVSILSSWICIGGALQGIPIQGCKEATDTSLTEPGKACAYFS